MLSVINESDFQINSGIYVLKFEAAWCGPCKRMQPIILQLESEFPTINFVSIDIDETASLAQKYCIRALPTILVIKNNEEYCRLTGLSPIESIRKILLDLTEL